MRGKLLLVVAILLVAPAAAYADGGNGDLEVQFPQTWLAVPEPGVDVMTANLDSMYEDIKADGNVIHRSWYDTNGAYRRSFRIDVVVLIPSKLPGFDNLHDAMDADVRVQFSHHGFIYAECMLALEPVVARSHVHFAVDLASYNDAIKPNRGICDLDYYHDGILEGIPSLEHGVMVKTLLRGETIDEFVFMDGYCD